MPTTIKANDQSRDRVLSLSKDWVEGDDTPTRLENLSQQPEELVCLSVIHVVQHSRHDSDVHRCESVRFYRPEKSDMKVPAVAIRVPRLFHIRAVRLPTDVVHVWQVRAQLRRSAANIKDAISWLGAHEALCKVAPQRICAHEALDRFVHPGIPQARI